MSSAIWYVCHVGTMFCTVITENGLLNGIASMHVRVCVRRCCATLDGSAQENWMNLLNSESNHMSESSYGDGSAVSSRHSSLSLPHVTQISALGNAKKKEKKVLFAVEHHRKPNRCVARSWSPSFGSAKHMKSVLHLGLISSDTACAA